eukprot:c9596_g1_i1.p1 GENE.c9596_g1_i1~~c9596_g1_i1.p1  ORF type:complete len:499 (+),score=143.88 c9596_g1_i1:61-1497(+)
MTKSLFAVCICVSLFVISSLVAFSDAKVLSITDFGAIPGSDSQAKNNSIAILNTFLAAGAGDTVLVPANATFSFFGVWVQNLSDIIFQIEGTLKAVNDFNNWPSCSSPSDICDVIRFQNCTTIVVTSATGKGLVDGQGYVWWWNEILQLLPNGRPKLFVFSDCANIVVEHVTLINSPSWNLVMDDVAQVIIRYVTVHMDVEEIKSMLGRRGLLVHVGELFDVPWKQWLADLLIDLRIPTFPLNTDGIDLTGRDMHVHDCKVFNFDDSIVPKPSNRGHSRANCTENILIENIEAEGFGMSIGSVPPNSNFNCVNNVTMRNVTMRGSGKGIYVKTNPGSNGNGIISNILFEDFKIIKPYWWAVWIGPQQQNQPGWGPDHPECALSFPIKDSCMTQPLVPIVNITLRNVLIDSPLLSPGVIRCNETRFDGAGPSCQGLVFDNVQVTGESTNLPYGDAYACWNVADSVAENSAPVPPCFKQK